MNISKVSFEEANINTKFHRDLLKQKHGISGTGITHYDISGKGYGKIKNGIQIIVYIEQEDEETLRNIPFQIEGYEVVYRVIGRVRTLDCLPISIGYQNQNLAFTNRERPIKSGSSVGHYTITAGTIGGFPVDDTTGQKVLLSNNHVLAVNWGETLLGLKGDAILQPGPCCIAGRCTDCGQNPVDKVASLERWEQVKLKSTNEKNLIDCGIAKLDTGIEISDTTLCNYIQDRWIDPQVGMFVKKSSRTSECNEGYIEAINVEIDVQGSNSSTDICTFSDQISILGSTEPFAKGGDSGSIAVHTDTNNIVGLVFAGDGTTSFMNRIENVQNLLNVSFGLKAPDPPTQERHKECKNVNNIPTCVPIRGAGIDECKTDIPDCRPVDPCSQLTPCYPDYKVLNLGFVYNTAPFEMEFFPCDIIYETYSGTTSCGNPSTFSYGIWTSLRIYEAGSYNIIFSYEHPVELQVTESICQTFNVGTVSFGFTSNDKPFVPGHYKNLRVAIEKISSYNCPTTQQNIDNNKNKNSSKFIFHLNNHNYINKNNYYSLVTGQGCTELNVKRTIGEGYSYDFDTKTCIRNDEYGPFFCTSDCNLYGTRTYECLTFYGNRNCIAFANGSHNLKECQDICLKYKCISNQYNKACVPYINGFDSYQKCEDNCSIHILPTTTKSNNNTKKILLGVGIIAVGLFIFRRTNNKNRL